MIERSLRQDQFSEKIIFTACTGRCGQNSLGAYFNRFGIGCFSEMEPPDLIYKQHWPLGNWMRNIQRKWIVTHEDLGRGKALLWFDRDEREKMEILVKKRLRRIKRLLDRHQAHIYVELSKFFIRSYCDELHRQNPEIGIILLRRDPLMNARSFANRDKNFELDGVMPYFRKACFPIDIGRLSKFQLYLWQWAEIELRFQRFVEEHRIEKYCVFLTEDLNDPDKVTGLFDFFNIKTREPIRALAPLNSNASQGRADTYVGREDLDAFKKFLDMVPPKIMDQITYIRDYLPQSQLSV